MIESSTGRSASRGPTCPQLPKAAEVFQEDDIAGEHDPLKHGDVHRVLQPKVEQDARAQHRLAEARVPDEGRHGDFDAHCRPGCDLRKPQRVREAGDRKPVKLDEVHHVIHGRAVVPRVPLQLPKRRRGVHHADLNLQQPLRPDLDERRSRPLEPAAQVPVTIDGIRFARRREHQKERQRPHQMVAAVQDVDVPMVQRHEAHPHRDRRRARVIADREGDRGQKREAHEEMDHHVGRMQQQQQVEPGPEQISLGHVAGQNAAFAVPDGRIGPEQRDGETDDGAKGYAKQPQRIGGYLAIEESVP